jgi:hypothetical protein
MELIKLKINLIVAFVKSQDHLINYYYMKHFSTLIIVSMIQRMTYCFLVIIKLFFFKGIFILKLYHD